MKGLRGEVARAFLLANLSFVINFAGNMVLVRLLTPQIFGTYALAVALLGVVEIFTTFSLHTIYIQRRPSRRLLAALVQAILGIGAIKCVIVLVIFLTLRGHYGSEVWMLFAIIFLTKLLVPFNALLVAILDKQFRFASSTLVTSLSNSLSVGVAVAAASLGGGLFSLAARDVLPVLITLGMGLFLNRSVRFDWQRLNWRQSRTLLRSALDMYAVRATELGFGRLPLIVVQHLFGTEALGYLHQAFYLLNSVNRVTAILNQQIALVYFNRYRRDRARSVGGFRILVAISMVLGAGVALALFFFPETIIRILWGERWMGARDMLQFMSFLVFLIPIFTILKSQLLGKRRNLYVAVTYATGAIAIVPLLLLLSPLHQPGVAISIAYLATYAILALMAARGVFTGPRGGFAPVSARAVLSEGPSD